MTFCSGMQKSSVKSLELIKADQEIAIWEIAAHLAISVHATEKQIAKLKAENKIKRVGARRGGH